MVLCAYVCCALFFKIWVIPPTKNISAIDNYHHNHVKEPCRPVGNWTTRPNSQGDHMTPNQGKGLLIGLLTRFTTRPKIWWDNGTSRPSFKGLMVHHFTMRCQTMFWLTHRAMQLGFDNLEKETVVIHSNPGRKDSQVSK